MSDACFDPDCRACPRLAAHLNRVSETHPDYHARPVPAFGDAVPRLLIVGLAPGMHGANRTGRPFTGDYAGILLYKTLHDLGLASQPEGKARNDGLRLIDCRITNAVKCLPPDNTPTSSEVRRCNGYLRAEIEMLPAGAVVLALGAVAHRAVLMAMDLRPSGFPFAHGRLHRLTSGRRLVDSYHCSRYNTQTRRLTPPMFKRALKRARDLAVR
ncbi:MAG TPA: uracil-DNA glycosylase [Gammaproteobacteria bacterium]|nr:uracil-DNA glycosylase [Gammaproteobacteria bacterium]